MAVTMQKEIFSLAVVSVVFSPVPLKCCLASLSGRIVQSSSPLLEDGSGTGMDPSPEFLEQQHPTRTRNGSLHFLKKSHFPLASIEMEVQK